MNTFTKQALAAAIAAVAFNAAADTKVTHGTLGTARTQTITTSTPHSMSQSSQLHSPSIKVGGASVSGFGSATTTVSGGYAVGGSGQPITNNTRGSSSQTVYGVGVEIRRGK